MSFMDGCEERAFEHGRSVAIEGFTTKELVGELCKRDGVGVMLYREGDGAVHFLTSGNGTILVVKK
jgi:hypothetical protein